MIKYRRLIGAALLLLALSAWSAGTQSKAAIAAKPNIIFILTDDQDFRSLSPRVMPNTWNYLVKGGMMFPNHILTTPVCCPSRATFMSGQYSHNHGVWSNDTAVHGGFPYYYKDIYDQRSRALTTAYNIGAFLQHQGYSTAMIGKYLNGYGYGYDPNIPGSAPPVIEGWNRWFVTMNSEDQKYYNYTVRTNDQLPSASDTVTPDPANGVISYHALPGSSAEAMVQQDQTYSSTVFTDQAIDTLSQHTGVSETGQALNEPVNTNPAFLFLSYDAPHDTNDQTLGTNLGFYPEPLPEDRFWFNYTGAPQKSAFNEGDVSDKPDYVKQLTKLSFIVKRHIHARVRARWQSLYSLDRQLGRLYNYLELTGLSKNTILIFTTDNGYMLGEHRIRKSKFVPYEESIRFPLLIRGPQVPAGQQSNALVANVDFVPTVLSLAGTDRRVAYDQTTGARMPFDGINISKQIYNPKSDPARTAVLVEVAPNGAHTIRPYRAVRTNRYIYIQYYSKGSISDFYNSWFHCRSLRSMGCSSSRSELYDLKDDPAETQNLLYLLARKKYRRAHPNLVALSQVLKKEINKLRACSGRNCTITTEFK